MSLSFLQVIEHFFHHPSHAPFLSLRFLQRFGLSNPSPGLVERVATAYIEGSYNGIGSGSYGDLSALVAAILLDDESRSTTLEHRMGMSVDMSSRFERKSRKCRSETASRNGFDLRWRR